MRNELTDKLKAILTEFRNNIPENEFCGIGVILYSDISKLPILPLCHNQSSQNDSSLVEQLIKASLYSNPCHDGFHLISLEYKLTHANQYFAPPLPHSSELVDFQTSNLGARYVSAQIGSLLAGICCTGIISDRDGLIIFENGKVIK